MTDRGPTPADPRSRILDAALALMSTHGAAGTSMRQLAGACGLNVATLYHYFPSKVDLLQAVIAERRYGERLAGDIPPVDSAELPADRLAALFRYLWEETASESPILRLIVGEGLRGNPTARGSARELIAAVDSWLTEVLEKTFPELPTRGVDPADLARVLRGQLLGLIAEHLATGHADPDRAAQALAATLASWDTSLPSSTR